MTTWQWSVIIALCRIVIRLIVDRTDIPWDEEGLLHDAVHRDNMIPEENK